MTQAAATYDLGKLHGGIRLPGDKEVSTSREVIVAPIPELLVIPITQHVGEPARPIVSIGERVLKGQMIADMDENLGAPVHASSSGKVVAIEPWPVSRRNGEAAPCIVIETDGHDRSVELTETPAPFSAIPPQELVQQILQGGIVGLGGAVFPTAQKLLQANTTPLTHLILNGVECEPYISCDDMLMRTHAREMLGGAQILMHALGLNQCFVAVETDKQEAIHEIGEELANLEDERIVIKQVPTIYPSGGEDQLVQLVTNLEVPSGGLPTDVGCVVQNVGTATAIYRWIVERQPLISRIATVSGDGVQAPVNVEVRIGTSVAEIVKLAGGYTERANQMIIGGPMTGKSVSTDRVPVVKATNCVLVLSEISQPGAERPCIRCGECALVCPIQLQPQQLFWYACSDNEKQLRSHGLTDCIECGCCDLVCPSHIPLTADFRHAKARMHEMADEKARAERARLRFETRNVRLDMEGQQRTEELSRQKTSVMKAGPEAIRDILKRTQGQSATDEDEEG